MIAASGPSLRAEDIASFRGVCPVMVINNTFRAAPWADVLYSCDHKWWKEYHAEVEARFTGERWTCSIRAAHEFRLQHVPSRSGTGYDPAESYIRHGLNSGMQAMGLAAKWGATRLLLLGFDHRPSADGRKHWHADHASARLNTTPEWKQHVAGVHRLVEQLGAAGVEVLNTTRETALDISRVTVDQALQLLAQTPLAVAA